jgi:hypothetical protein
MLLIYENKVIKVRIFYCLSGKFQMHFIFLRMHVRMKLHTRDIMLKMIGNGNDDERMKV